MADNTEGTGGPAVTPGEMNADDGLENVGHLIRPAGGDWAMWRTVGLRAAGFPAREVLKLAAPACAAAADQLLEAEAAWGVARQGALAALAAAAGSNAPEGHGPRLAALRLLKKGRVPAPLQEAGEAAEALDRFRGADLALDSLREEFGRAFGEGSAEVSRAIVEVARGGRFREALVWQNRQAVETAVLPLLRKPAERRGAKERQQERLIASYLQRYCTKNDSIGFFGPIGWAEFDARAEALVVRPGPGLLAARAVYFEFWCVEALAKKIGEDKALRPWLVPRPSPSHRLEGATLLRPPFPPLRLTEQQAAILRACDGRRTARDVAAELIGGGRPGLTGPASVYDLLAGMAAGGLLSWGLELPVDTHPELELRRILYGVEDESLRRPALEMLDQLEARHREVGEAAGDAEALGRALGELGATFSELTGAAATRSAGQTYAARTPVYEDCRRDLEVTLGGEVARALERPLSLLLTGARWITHRAAEVYRQIFNDVYFALKQRTGTPAVDATTFWAAAHPHLYQKRPPVLAIVGEFQRRWAEILSLPEGRRRVRYASEDLRARVEAAFAAPCAGWMSARHHSPDVMISAADAEAVGRGEYELVLGEIHVAANTLTSACRLAQHPAAEEITRAVGLDMAEPRVLLVPPKSWLMADLRTRRFLATGQDYQLLSTPDALGVAGVRTLQIASLVIEAAGSGGPYVRTRDGSLRFDIVEVFADIISMLTLNAFKLIEPRPRAPRVNLDQLVIARETWNFRGAEAATFAHEKDAAARFLAARRWARGREMPRFVFVKVPVEQKPFYVDFDSPVYVDIFAKMIRRTVEGAPPDALIAVSEMLPTHEQSWLPDAEANRYTSEFRIVALDLRRPGRPAH